MGQSHGTTTASTTEQANRSSSTGAPQISSMFGAPRVTPTPTVTLINEPPPSTVTSAMNRPFSVNSPPLSTPFQLPTAPNTDYLRSQNLMPRLGGSTSQDGHSLGHHDPATAHAGTNPVANQVAPTIKSVTQNKMRGSVQKNKTQRKPYVRPPPMSPTVTDHMMAAIENVATGANKEEATNSHGSKPAVSHDVTPIIKSVTQKKMRGVQKNKTQRKPYIRPPPMSPTVIDHMMAAIENTATGASNCA